MSDGHELPKGFPNRYPDPLRSIYTWCAKCEFKCPQDDKICIDCLEKTHLERGLCPKPHNFEVRP